MGKVENIGRILYYHQTNSDVHPRKQRNSVNRIAPANHDTVSLDRLRGSMTGHSSKYDCHLYVGWESLHVEIWGPHLNCSRIPTKYVAPKSPKWPLIVDFSRIFPLRMVIFQLHLISCCPFEPHHPSACVEALVFCISMAVRRAPCAVSRTAVIQSPSNSIHIWVCLKMGYTLNYSRLVGIMIINHWV